MNRVLTVAVMAEEEGKTIECIMREKIGLTRAQIRSMRYRENGICVNGSKVRTSHILKAGEELSLLLEEKETESGHLVPVQQELEVLYEDADVICVWKKAGMPVHPSGIHYQDSLSNYLCAYFLDKKEKNVIRSIGRLDLDTAGIMVFAKSQVAAARLWKQKEEGIFIKEYLAWCYGSFPEEAYLEEQQINSPLRRMDQYTMETAENGKEAVTWYQVLESKMENKETISKIKVRIETGRMHQIRVHMASIGHPLINDRRYGECKPQTGNDGYLRLYAHKTTFFQPFSGEKIELFHEVPR